MSQLLILLGFFLLWFWESLCNRMGKLDFVSFEYLFGNGIWWFIGNHGSNFLGISSCQKLRTYFATKRAVPKHTATSVGALKAYFAVIAREKNGANRVSMADAALFLAHFNFALWVWWFRFSFLNHFTSKFLVFSEDMLRNFFVRVEIHRIFPDRFQHVKLILKNRTLKYLEFRFSRYHHRQDDTCTNGKAHREN